MKHNQKVPTFQPRSPELLDIAQAAGGWPAVYSCNKHGQVWPFATWCRTPESRRRYLQGAIPLLDDVVDAVLSARPQGGRFRIRDGEVILVATAQVVARLAPVPWRAS